MERNPLARENLADLGREFEIEIADAAHAVCGKVHNHFIPDIAPFRMVVHGFGHQSHTRHAAEGGDEVLALKGAVKFSVLNCPAAEALQSACDFLLAQLFCAHRSIPPASPSSTTSLPSGRCLLLRIGDIIRVPARTGKGGGLQGRRGIRLNGGGKSFLGIESLRRGTPPRWGRPIWEYAEPPHPPTTGSNK